MADGRRRRAVLDALGQRVSVPLGAADTATLAKMAAESAKPYHDATTGQPPLPVVTASP